MQIDIVLFQGLQTATPQIKVVNYQSEREAIEVVQNMSDFPEIKTYLAPLLSEYRTKEADSLDQPIPIKTHKESFQREEAICWLDLLLGGGFKIPEHSRPLIVMFTGPSGTGKSLAAHQICQHRALEFLSQPRDKGKDDFSSCILCFESKAEAIRDHHVSLGWDKVIPDKGIPIRGIASIKEKEEKETGVAKTKIQCQLNCATSKELFEASLIKLVDCRTKTFRGSLAHFGRASDFRQDLKELLKQIINQTLQFPTGILVLDGLSSMRIEWQSEVFSQILNEIQNDAEKNSCQLCLIIVDDESTPDAPAHSHISHQADVVVRFRHERIQGSMRRSIEIEKARFQNHVRGTHVLKTYDMPENEHGTNVDPAGSRPVLPFGGVFVFPSMDFVLSKQRLKGGSPFVTNDRLREVKGGRLSQGNQQCPFRELHVELGGVGRHALVFFRGDRRWRDGSGVSRRNRSGVR